jgi:hypothetical protein
MQKNNPKWSLVLLALGPDAHIIHHAGRFPVIQERPEKMAHPGSFLLIVMCCAQSSAPPPPLLFCPIVLSIVIVLPKVDPRNKVGMIDHAVLDALHHDCPPPLPPQQQRVLLAPGKNNDDGNDNDNKDNLIRFANNASLAISCICGCVGGPTSTAAAAAVAAVNASSCGKGIKQSTSNKQKFMAKRMAEVWSRLPADNGNAAKATVDGCGCSNCSGSQGNGGGRWLS